MHINVVWSLYYKLLIILVTERILFAIFKAYIFESDKNKYCIWSNKKRNKILLRN